MSWMIMGAYEGKKGIEIIFENQNSYVRISRFFDASPCPKNNFVGTPLHKIRVDDPQDYKFDPKDFLGKFKGIAASNRRK